MSTVLDLANFAIMQMSQGRFHDQQILSPASIATMQAPHASLYTLNDASYGLTFGTESYKGQRVVGHTGGISSFISRFSMIPAEGGAVILLFNRAAANFDSDRIINTIFDQFSTCRKKPPRQRQSRQSERSGSSTPAAILAPTMALPSFSRKTAN